jgi:hypothetical protein
MFKFLKKLFSRPEYGCDCPNKTFTKIREEAYNTYYKCNTCGSEDHLKTYRGGTVSVNPRMRVWYSKKCFDEAFNKPTNLKLEDLNIPSELKTKVLKILKDEDETK